MVACAVVCLCALADSPGLVLGLPGEEMEVVRSHLNRDNLTSRTRCVWGNTVVPEHPPSSKTFP